MTENPANDTKEWIVRLLNLPPTEQFQFLFRHNLELALREEIEKKVLGDSKSISD